MSNKRIYRRINVKQIELEILRQAATAKGDCGTTVGLDIAKAEIVAVVRWSDGSFERPWSVQNPLEIGLLVERLLLLKEVCGSLVVGLESTGTYSEAVRCAMTQSFLEVHRLSGKGVADYKEIFDGVPQPARWQRRCHDRRTGTLWQRHPVALRAALRARPADPPSSPSTRSVSHTHQPMAGAAGRDSRQALAGTTEPTAVVQCHTAQTSASPTEVQQNLPLTRNAGQQLRSWGRGQLSFNKIDAIIESARQSFGIPLGEHEHTWLRECAEEAHRALSEVKQCEKAAARTGRKPRGDETFNQARRRCGRCVRSGQRSAILGSTPVARRS